MSSLLQQSMCYYLPSFKLPKYSEDSCCGRLAYICTPVPLPETSEAANMVSHMLYQLNPPGFFPIVSLIFRGLAVLTINSSALSPSCGMECWTLNSNLPIIWCIPLITEQENSLPRICRSNRYVPLKCCTQNQYIPNASRASPGSLQLTEL